jgi:hypothetical protein
MARRVTFVFIFVLSLRGSAWADTNSPAEALALALGKAAPQLLNENGEVQAAIDKGILSPAPGINDFPAKPDDDLEQNILQIEQYGPNPNLQIQWISSAKLGSAFSVQGSGHYQDWLIFTADSKGAHMAPTPDVFDVGSCEGCDVGLYFGQYKQWPVAVNESDNPALDGTAKNLLTISVQSWNGTQWSEQATIEAALQYQINPQPDFLSCATKSCENVSRLGFATVVTFFRNPNARALSIELSSEDKAKFSAMEGIANVGKPPNVFSLGPIDSLPIINGKTYPGDMSPFYTFDPSSVVFPARLNGELVLGRIGHCTIGWRVDSDWHIGFWKLAAGKLEPVGAAVFSVEMNPKITSITYDWLVSAQ